jgi:type I restriction enzyme S subunit
MSFDTFISLAYPMKPIGFGAEFLSGYAFKSGDFCDKGIPVVKIKNIQDKIVSIAGSQCIPEELITEKLKKFLLKDGDVLIAMTGQGSVGRVGRVSGAKNQNPVMNQRVGKFVTNETSLNKDFLYYVISSDFFERMLFQMGAGSGQPNLSPSAILSLNIPFPLYAEQVRVSELLNTLDNRIALLKDTNTTLEAIARALFKSWFIDFDPVRAKLDGRVPEGMDEAMAALFPDELEASELGAVPIGWGVGTLANMSVLNPESWSTKKHPDIIAYVDLANAKDNEISEVVDYEFDEAPSRARRVLRSGDTILGTVRPGNRSFAYIHAPPGNLTGSTGFAVLRPSSVENTEFVYLAATQASSIEHLTHVADGGAYPAVRPDVVSALRCVVPIPEVLTAFHGVTAPLLENVCENHRRARTLASLRDTLLPRLISGQLRLADVENQIEAIAT